MMFWLFTASLIPLATWWWIKQQFTAACIRAKQTLQFWIFPSTATIPFPTTGQDASLWRSSWNVSVPVVPVNQLWSYHQIDLLHPSISARLFHYAIGGWRGPASFDQKDTKDQIVKNNVCSFCPVTSVAVWTMVMPEWLFMFFIWFYGVLLFLCFLWHNHHHYDSHWTQCEASPEDLPHNPTSSSSCFLWGSFIEQYVRSWWFPS